MNKNIVKIRYDDSYVHFDRIGNSFSGRVGGKTQHVFRSEINYIKGKPYWKGKEIYEIIEQC